MRAPLLGPLAASGFLSLTSAQAPQYGQPGSESSLGSGDSGSDGAANTSPSCHQEIATTVFVTVSPTSPAYPSDGSLPDDMPSVQTVTETVPATTVFVSAGAPDTSGDSDDTSPTPFVSDGSPHDSDGSDVSSLISSVTVEPSVTDSVVKPFTTLTIDIWDNASEQNGDPEQTSSDTAPSSAMTDSSESSDKPSSDENGSTDDSGDGNAADSGSWTTDAGTDTSTPTAYGPTEDSQQSTDGASAATTQNGADTTNDASTWYTVVTDSDVYWTTGPSGPSQVTILLSHTLTVDGPAPTASETYDTDQQSPQSRTVIGSDGKPTIIVDPSSLPDADNGQVSQQHPACTKTITGADGRATIIIEPIDDGTGSGDAVPSGAPSLTITGLPDSSFPSGYLGGPDQPPQSDYVPFSGIYTTFTSFGADGLPTVIESALPFPRPAPVTQSGPLPTQPLSDGQSGLPGPGSASTISPFGPQDDLGITTSFTFTYFGANGPTAVESTVVIFPTSAASDASNTLPTFFPNTVGATDGIPGPASATTTCFSYTLIGADGLPTVLDSTVVLSPTNGGSNGYPVPIISAIPGASEGIPAPGGAPVTTAFSHTFVGTDGYPTVLATTLVITPPDGAPTPTFTNWPSNGVPTDFPPISGDEGARKGAPIATCTTFTYIGLDGNPTVTEYTYTTAEPVTAATALPGDITPPLGFPGSPTPGVPGFPGVPDNQPIITSTTFTYIGPDGNPTVTAYTYTTAGPVGAVTALPGGVTPPIGFPGSPTLGVPGLPDNAAITTCTTFTYIGADGKPTVTDYTWTASAPVTAATALPGNAVPGFSVPAFPTPGFPGNGDDSALTTGATYTVIGADGRPTITEASWIIPGPFATQTPLPFPQIPADGSNGLPSGIPGQITGSPGLPPSNGPENRGAATTVCTSYTILGADGNPTVIETTWTVPIVGPIPTPTSLGFPSAVPAITDLPQGIPTGNAVTTSYTAFSIGPDGVFTPVVQTIVYTPGAQSATAGLPLPSGVIDESSAAGVPALSQYGPESSETEAGFPAFPPGFTPIITDGRQLPVSGILPPLITGTVTATSTSTLTATSLPWPGFPDAPEGLPPSYGNANNGGPDDSGLGGLVQSSSGGSDGLPSELTLWPSSVVYGDSTGNPPGATTPCSTTTLRTSTWVNVIPEQTTTYTMNYPLTTLVALPTPALVPSMKRAVRRQEFIEFSQLWSNSTMRAPAPFTPLPSSTFSPAPSSATPSSQPTLCSNGGNVGNYTLNFDDLPSGSLYNPDGDFWFSEGFSVVPPSAQAGSFAPSSGGQLLEFTPLSISLSSGGGSGDTAEIGVGPHFAVPCFKFNLYGLSLGCAAEGNEQWCEFEFSAYAYDESTGDARSTSWSETKRVPACPEYPAGPCSLTPVELEGYTNITSVLITLRVGLDLRVWWADDLRVGWTDNSCEAGTCRGDVSAAFAKRERSSLSLRNRIVQLMTSGLKGIQGLDG